jgi:hypothetical protein
MFQRHFRIVLTQAQKSNRTDFNVMTLNCYKALLPTDQAEAFERFTPGSEFQFQGHWTYYNSNSQINPTLGNAAPRENRYWRYNMFTFRFKFVTIGKNTDDTPAIDECAELYEALPDNQMMIKPRGDGEGNGFILRASSFFWSAHMTWDSDRYYDGVGYEP